MLWWEPMAVPFCPFIGTACLMLRSRRCGWFQYWIHFKRSVLLFVLLRIANQPSFVLHNCHTNYHLITAQTSGEQMGVRGSSRRDQPSLPSVRVMAEHPFGDNTRSVFVSPWVLSPRSAAGTPPPQPIPQGPHGTFGAVGSVCYVGVQADGSVSLWAPHKRAQWPKRLNLSKTSDCFLLVPIKNSTVALDLCSYSPLHL